MSRQTVSDRYRHQSAMESWTIGSNTWEQVASAGVEHNYGHSGGINGKIYVVGNDNPSSTTEEYDPATDTWTTKAAFTGDNGYGFSAAAVAGKLHVCGGYRPSPAAIMTQHYAYDPVANSWESRAAVYQHYGGAGVEHDGLFYVSGGDQTGGIGGSPLPLSTHRVYDPSTNTWTTKASLPVTRVYGKSAGHGDYIYSTGGTANGTNVYRYDVAGNSWSSRAAMPTARSHHAIGVLDDKIHIAGGGSAVSSTMHIYDIAGNSWSSGDALPAAHEIPSYGVANGKLYVVGSTTGSLTRTDAYGVAPGEFLVGDTLFTLAAPTLLTSLIDGIELQNKTKGVTARTVGGEAGDEIAATATGTLKIVRTGG